MTTLLRIISGGQTGVDQGAMFGARDCGFPTGGWAPRGWMTEVGPAPDLLQSFGLKEHAGGYEHRTWSNVEDSSATLLIGDNWSPGSRCMYHAAEKLGKPV